MNLMGMEMEVVKRMANEFRRVGEIDVVLNMPVCNSSPKERAILQRITHTCAVRYSLNDKMIQNITFNWK